VSKRLLERSPPTCCLRSLFLGFEGACQYHNLSSQTFSEFAENAGRVSVIDVVTRTSWDNRVCHYLSGVEAVA